LDVCDRKAKDNSNVQNCFLDHIGIGVSLNQHDTDYTEAN